MKIKFVSSNQRKAMFANLFSKCSNRFALYRVKDDPMIVRSTENPQVDMIVPEDYKFFEFMKQMPDEWYSGLKSVTYRTDNHGGSYRHARDIDGARNNFINKNKGLIGQAHWNESTLGDYFDSHFKKKYERLNEDVPNIAVYYNTKNNVIKHEIAHHLSGEASGYHGESFPETVSGNAGSINEGFNPTLHHFDDVAYATSLMHLKNPTYEDIEIIESGIDPDTNVIGIKEDFGKILDVGTPEVRENYNKLLGEKK